jgi:hypothetical protein
MAAIRPDASLLRRAGECVHDARQGALGRSVVVEDCVVSEDELRKRLEVLKIEHRDLDAAIDALTLAGAKDQLQIARLKKRKLKLRDQISLIEDYLIPDIIA